MSVSSGCADGVIQPTSRSRWFQSYCGRRLGWAVTGLICVLNGSVPRPARGHEPAEAFLQELKTRGYYELALEYLDRLEKSGVAPEEFQPTIDYQQGEVLIQAAIQQRSLSRKQEDLDRAQREFEEFTSEHAEHSLSAAARGRLGDILMERARLLVMQSDQSTVPDQRREELRAQARQLFDQAAERFATNQAQLRTRLEQIPKALSPQTDAALFHERELLRAEYVQAQLVAAQVKFEQAMTYAEGSEQRGKLLQEAEKQFGPVAEKYRRTVAGLRAVLYQGRCRQQQGDLKGALAYFEDLFDRTEDDAALRPLRTKALLGAMECWVDAEIAQYEAARQHAEEWLGQQRPNEQSDDDWLMVQQLLAETYVKLVETGQAGRDKSELNREARRLSLEVARFRSPAQTRAQELLARLGHVTQTVAQTKPLATFADALSAARDALSQRQVAAETINLLEQRLPRVDAADGRTEIEQRLAETRSQLEQAQATALDCLRQAQGLVTDETPMEEVNQVRYYLCTLYYFREDYHAAAVIAEFLSSRFPASEEGRRAASVALASLVRLYGDGSSDWAPSLYQRMTVTAERIAQQWKGEAEADDALVTLISLAVRQGKTDDALGYLQRMSPDSPKRAAAELAAGQSLWNRAVSGVQADGSPDRTAERQQQAIELLDSGLRRSTGHPPTTASVAAAMVVAQHLVNTGQPARAVELLEDPAIGPKTLADHGHVLLQANDLRQRVYLLAVLANVSSLTDKSADAAAIDRALAVLEKLTSTNETANQPSQVASMYVMIARTLHQQIESAPADRREALVQAFAQLLERAVASTNELSILNWAADSYVSLSAAVKDDGRSAAAAQSYLRQAVTTYQEILKRADAGQFTVTPQERLLIDTRLAMALREQGAFEEALDRFAAILSVQPNQVYVQMEAARTLERWGDSGDHAAYLKAILGDRPDPQTQRNTIWGYGRIAKLIASKSDLRELFFAARYGVAACRYQYALQLPAQERAAALAQAEQDILLTAKLYPDLGGDHQKPKFSQLLQQIQQSLGKRVTGLPS